MVLTPQSTKNNTAPSQRFSSPNKKLDEAKSTINIMWQISEWARQETVVSILNLYFQLKSDLFSPFYLLTCISPQEEYNYLFLTWLKSQSIIYLLTTFNFKWIPIWLYILYHSHASFSNIRAIEYINDLITLIHSICRITIYLELGITCW